MNNISLQERVISDLHDIDIGKRFRAIQQLPKLKDIEATQIVRGILLGEADLGIKLEVLRVIHRLINNQTYRTYCSVLEVAIKDSDQEVVRNVLIAIRDIPPCLIPGV